MQTASRRGTVRAAIAGVALALIAALFAPGLGTAAAGATTNSGGDPGSDAWNRVPINQVAEVCGLDPTMLASAVRSFSGDSIAVVRYGELCWTGGSRSPDTTYLVTEYTE